MVALKSFLPLWILAYAAFGCGAPPKASSISVFAAASLTEVMEALASSYESHHPDVEVVINVGSTSLMARQITLGAPAHLFLAANEDWLRYVEDRGFVGRAEAAPFTNRLVLATNKDSMPISKLGEWPEHWRLALADPTHVPAGIYAQSLLKCMQVWEQLQDHVIPALDVRAALLTVEQGAVDAGIVYASDVGLESDVQVVDLLSPECQPMVTYYFALLKQDDDSPTASFLAYITDRKQWPVWRSFGFSMVGDESS